MIPFEGLVESTLINLSSGIKYTPSTYFKFTLTFMNGDSHLIQR